jgi:hypothetical protein
MSVNDTALWMDTVISRTRSDMGRPILADKQCSQCKIRKDKSEFYGKERKSGTCKSCQGSNQNLRRDFVVEHLRNNSCVDCGESDPVVLDFDHRDRDAKSYALSKMVRFNFTLERFQEEIDKCDVRCSNCHRRRTANELGWFHRNV